ncbi:MAG: DUF1874 domain-containing protein [Elusimicrobiales bacterium]|jgi:hypothetical protein|nr:DUF1874 domain-containing protein [Elusimicrobiales bacterium]
MNLLSSFSLSMIKEYPCEIKACEISEKDVKELIATNALTFKIGHPSFAEILSKRFGCKIDSLREKVIINKGESAVVAQIITSRLPEGKVLGVDELENTEIKFIKIEVL